MTLPKTIQLTPAEQQELTTRARLAEDAPPTLARYWQQIFAARDITIPHDKVPFLAPKGPKGNFTLVLHSKALGPKAIADGIAFRAISQKKDEDYDRKLVAQGRF